VSAALLDTSVFIAREQRRPIEAGRIPDSGAISVITVGELWAGVLAAEAPADRARRLETLQRATRLAIVTIDSEVAATWARLRIAMHHAGCRMKANDSWIAATAVSLGVPIVTQDDDFDDVPEVQVVKV
jgi:predicted nucleic acid-binding protein